MAYDEVSDMNAIKNVELNYVDVLVSIIIPVYNVEQYLTECVNSVLDQSYRNLEILLIDDGSTDGSGDLCDSLEKRDVRIRVIHKPNGGLSDARNVGIEYASGEYLYFLDSDDVIAKRSIEILLKICLEGKSELALTGMKMFRTSNGYEEIYGGTIEYLSTEQVIGRMLVHNGYGHEAPGKLYHRKLWENYRFPKGKLYEDYATIYKVAGEAKRAGIYSVPLYYYRMRDGSIMRTSIKEKNLMLLDISDEVTEYISKKYPSLSKVAVYLQTVTYLKLMKSILDSGFNAFGNAQRRIKIFVRQNRKMLLRSKSVKNADKIKIITFSINKYLFYFVYKIGDWRNTRNTRCNSGNR